MAFVKSATDCTVIDPIKIPLNSDGALGSNQKIVIPFPINDKRRNEKENRHAFFSAPWMTSNESSEVFQ